MIATFVLIAFLAVDACWATGWGTGNKNSNLFPHWDDKHQSFDDCVQTKCVEACQKKDSISKHAPECRYRLLREAG